MNKPAASNSEAKTASASCARTQPPSPAGRFREVAIVGREMLARYVNETSHARKACGGVTRETAQRALSANGLEDKPLVEMPFQGDMNVL